MLKLIVTMLTITIIIFGFFDIKDKSIGPDFLRITKVYVDTIAKTAYVIDYDQLFNFNYGTETAQIYWSKRKNVKDVNYMNNTEFVSILINNRGQDVKNPENARYVAVVGSGINEYKVVNFKSNEELFTFKYQHEYKKKLIPKFEFPALIVVPSIIGILLAYLNAVFNLQSNAILIFGFILHTISSILIFLFEKLFNGFMGGSKSISFLALKYFICGYFVYLLYSYLSSLNKSKSIE